MGDMNMNGIPDSREMGMGMNPMMGGMGMNRGMGDMNMDGIPDGMQMGMGGMGMMNPCAPCIQCPLHTHDGGKCKAQLSDCDYNGFFGEMMENTDMRCRGPA